MLNDFFFFSRFNVPTVKTVMNRTEKVLQENGSYGVSHRLTAFILESLAVINFLVVHVWISI